MSNARQIGAKVAAFAGPFFSEIRALDCKPMAVSMEIDGIKYKSTKWPAGDGLDLWVRLGRVLGSGLTRMVATGDVENVDELAVIGALVAVCEKAQQESLELLARSVLRGVTSAALRGDKQGNVVDHFDEHFAGEYGHLLKVCAFAIAHNLKGPTFGVR